MQSRRSCQSSRRAAVALVVALVTAVALPAKQESYEEAVARASALVKAQKWQKASQAFEIADGLGDGCERTCLIPWSVALTRLGRFAEAMEILERAAALIPGDRPILDRLLETYELRREAVRGIRALRNHLAVLPPAAAGRVWAENELGYRLVTATAAEPDHLLQAERAFRRALEASAGASPTARINLAEVLMRQQHAIDALGVLDALIAAEDAAPEPAQLGRLSLSAEVSQRVVERGYTPPRPRERHTVRLASSRAGAPDATGVALPRRISMPTPPYTKEARKARIQGVVILQMQIDETGRVRDVRVTKGLPMGLSEAAVEAAYASRWEPATQDGKPVAIWYSTTTSFRLQ